MNFLNKRNYSVKLTERTLFFFKHKRRHEQHKITNKKYVEQKNIKSEVKHCLQHFLCDGKKYS